MKRLILTLAAVASVAGPMAVAGAADAQPRDWHHDRGEHRGYDRGAPGRDRSRHNGYYVGSRFYYGPPPAGRYDYRPGYVGWRRGGYLPRSYWGRDYIVYDYGRYGLRAPPYGYRWYNVNGDYVLAAIAGGLIADAILH